jgi:DNA-binding response OmpR family regulator
VAGDGRAALEAAWRRPPDVVLLDIGLPDMHGYEVARRLHEQHSRPPLVVAVTGRGDEEDRLASRYAGIDLHMVKPVSPGQLERVLRQMKELLADAAP